MNLVHLGTQVYLDVGITEDNPGPRLAHLKSLANSDHSDSVAAACYYGLVLLEDIQLMASAEPTRPVRRAKLIEYFATIGVENVEQEARSYIEKAAYLDFAPAQTRIGKAYEFSEMGLEQHKLSAQYYGLASAQDDPLADMGLSRWFTRGIDGLFEPDAYMVYAFAAKAAHNGSSAARRLLDLCRNLQITSREDQYLGVPWYGEAADALTRFHRENTSSVSVDKQSYFAQTFDDIVAIKEARNVLEELCKPCIGKTKSATSRSLGIIEISPFKLRNLQPDPGEISHNTYLTFSVGNQAQETKRTRKGAQTLEWDDELRLELFESDDDVVKHIVRGQETEGNTSQSLKMTCHLDHGEDFLAGVADIPLQTLVTNKEHDDWFRLESGRRSCEVYVELTFWKNGERPAQKPTIELKRPADNGHAVGSIETTHVRAIEDFDAMVPGELGFKKGEVITVVERAYDDFWRGHLRGKYGFFPVEFVVAVPQPTAILAKALYSFGGLERGELGFKKGDFIDIVDTSIDWWVGEIGDRQGRFPYYHVAVIEKPVLPVPEAAPEIPSEPQPSTVSEPDVPVPTPHRKPDHSAPDSQAPILPPPPILPPSPMLPPPPPPRETPPVLLHSRSLPPHPHPAARPVRAVSVHQWSFARLPYPRYGYRSQLWSS